jgi:DNA-binding NarL/FixJ family response regulator
MADDDLHLDGADLARLRDAVRHAQEPSGSVPRREVLEVHAAAPRNAGLTVDFTAAEELGMPLLVVRVPVGPKPAPVMRTLTPREFEVAGLVAAGYANKEIAGRLGIRTSTVKEHVHRILAKTSLPSRAAIARAYVGGPAASTDEDPGSDDRRDGG